MRIQQPTGDGLRSRRHSGRGAARLASALLIALACLLVASSLSARASGPAPQSAKTPKVKPATGSAYDVLALVNQVRAANGLAPFQANGALMAAAQAHSQYQASAGSASHTGSGGSTVKGRALAAGYGAGADVSVIENIYSGMGASPQNAVSWWQRDGVHLETLLSTRHNEAGAGLAEAGGVVYITLDVGAVLDGSAPAAPQAPAASPASPSGSTSPAAAAFNPLVLASPNPDGSLIHKVQPGQTLWTIAAAYQVPLPDLLQLNGLSENSFIFPGDEVLVKPASRQPEEITREPQTTQGSETPAAVSPTPQPSPTRTTAPANPAEPQESPPGRAQPDQVRTPMASSAGMGNVGLVFAAALLFAGAALMVFGNLLNRGG